MAIIALLLIVYLGAVCIGCSIRSTGYIIKGLSDSEPIIDWMADIRLARRVIKFVRMIWSKVVRKYIIEGLFKKSGGIGHACRKSK
jgi:hypothetical protein